MNRERTISLLLLLCFAVIPAHSIVPHYHHSGVINPLHGDTCPAGQHEHREAQGNQQPDHCHAFNEISFYKQALPGLSKPSEMPALYAYIASPLHSACVATIVSGVITPRSLVYLSWCGEQVNSLRGPPSSC